MTKKYILKPGRHQFAPGSHAVHNNNNLSDEEAEWYLEKYPHIAALFEKGLEAEKTESAEKTAIKMHHAVLPDDCCSINDSITQ